MQTTLDLTADIIDVRDIIERVGELESERDDYVGGAAFTDPTWATKSPDEFAELAALTAILTELAGNGGDEKWRGDWYPMTLIRETYFTDYAQELAEDCGMVNPQASWPNNCIDWEQAARELKYDYTSTDINGVTYYFR